MEKMSGWEDISNPIEGETGLGKYKVTKSVEDWKHLPGNHFTGVDLGTICILWLLIRL